jgi:hypothetical protein
MDEFSCEYEFEELRINGYGDGILLSGIAELASDQEPGEFYVKNIKLGSRWIDRNCHLGGNSFEGLLFKKISIALYADDAAEEFYAEQYEGSNGPNLDHVYDARKDRAALEEVA